MFFNCLLIFSTTLTLFIPYSVFKYAIGVIPFVFSWCNKQEVFNRIVCFVKINMMNLHTKRDFSIMFFPNNTMFEPKFPKFIFCVSQVSFFSFFMFHVFNIGFCVQDTETFSNIQSFFVINSAFFQ